MKLVLVRKELMFRNFCQGLTNSSRNMKQWLHMDLQDTLLILEDGWQIGNLANQVKA